MPANKKSGTSKSKGSDYERTICGRLSLWCSNLTRDDLFWRSAMSGGRANVPSRKSKGQTFEAQCGDVVATHAQGNHLVSLFVVECKFWRDLELQQPTFGLPGQMIPQWLKTYEEAKRTGRQPLFCAKQNHKADIVLTTAKGAQILRTEDPDCKLQETVILMRYSARVFLLQDILAEVKYSLIREAVKLNDAGRGILRSRLEAV